MSLNSNIEWCDHTINFYSWNCTKVSQGCKNCYAEAMAKRWGREFNGAPKWREAAVKELAKTSPGDLLFINSMSDTFHEGAELKDIARIFRLASVYSDRLFLLLTKRPHIAGQRIVDIVSSGGNYPTPNVWIGTSVESPDVFWRLDYLKSLPVKRFISFEPLLASVKHADLSGIDWIIVGGESGPNRRPFQKQWVRELRDKALDMSVLFFYKQGSANFPGRDCLLDGQEYKSRPSVELSETN